MTTRTRLASAASTAVFLLTTGWLVAPYASQDSANDGFILFTSDRHNPSARGMCGNCEDIYVMSADGTNVIRLTTGGDAAVVGGPPRYNSSGADWSHNRKLIVFNSNRVGGTPQVYLMNPDGSDQRPLVSLPVAGAGFPSFSETGDQVCFQDQDLSQATVALRRRDIFVVNADGTGVTNLTSPLLPRQMGDNIRCDWSPKGGAIAFQSTRDGNDEIYSMNADGSGLVRLTYDPDPVPGEAACRVADVNPTWSPKGDRIAFESNRSTELGKCTALPEIWVMNADGSNPMQLTDFSEAEIPSTYVVSKATWSPKGDRIAFHRRVGPANAQGHLQIYTIDLESREVTSITPTPIPFTVQFSGFPSWGKWSAQD
jgi:TolB protein